MGRGRNRASIELYEAQARDKALPGRKKCPLWHGGGKSASLEKAHWEWAKGIAPVDCVDKGEGGCSHVWEDPKRPLSSVNGRAATSSQRRRESVSCLYISSNLYLLSPLFVLYNAFTSKQPAIEELSPLPSASLFPSSNLGINCLFSLVCLRSSFSNSAS